MTDTMRSAPVPTPPPSRTASPRFAGGVSTLLDVSDLPGPDDPPKPIEIRNGGRKVRFVGVLLARVSSERPKSPRWTEIEIFRTESKQYVLHRVGVSRVAHEADCSISVSNRLPMGADFPTGLPDLAVFSPCPLCSPSFEDPNEVEKRAATLAFEKERHWAGVADTAEDAVSMLYRREGGQRSLPWTASDLLSRASEHDEALADAWAVENV